ncbi:hypothetical protein EI94DRAFT_1697232 [Lactarius quietus]|nr:hypothetical protein EI94DRAFT_1697232 [Lactarius quietus]
MTDEDLKKWLRVIHNAVYGCVVVTMEVYFGLFHHLYTITLKPVVLDASLKLHNKDNEPPHYWAPWHPLYTIDGGPNQQRTTPLQHSQHSLQTHRISYTAPQAMMVHFSSNTWDISVNLACLPNMFMEVPLPYTMDAPLLVLHPHVELQVKPESIFMTAIGHLLKCTLAKWCMMTLQEVITELLKLSGTEAAGKKMGTHYLYILQALGCTVM